MKIEDIIMDKEGLQRVIEFLHSEENFVDMTRREDSRIPLYRQAFWLTAAKTELPGGTYLITNAAIRYIVSLGSCESPEPPVEHVSQLLNLLKEVYKG